MLVVPFDESSCLTLDITDFSSVVVASGVVVSTFVVVVYTVVLPSVFSPVVTSLSSSLPEQEVIAKTKLT